MSGSSYPRSCDSSIQSGGKKVLKKPIMHPIFAEAAEYTDDLFWKNKLVDASRGRFPSGFSYNAHGYLTFKKKVTSSQQARKELSASPLRVVNEFIEFLKTNNHLCSDTDVGCAKTEEELSESLMISKKKGIQLSHIADYATRCMESWGMSKRQCRQFEHCIVRAHHIGVLPRISTFTEEEGLVSVESILYDSDRMGFFLDTSLFEAPVYTYNSSAYGSIFRAPRVTVKKIKVPTRVPYVEERCDKTLEDALGPSRGISSQTTPLMSTLFRK